MSWAPYIGSGDTIPGSTGSTLTFDANIDLRHYFKITKRSLFAMRLYGFRASGRLPDLLAFGGVDTLRTFNVYGLVGNTAGFFNLEFRFPLIDFLATPILGFSEIRGKVFIDVAGAALKGQPWQFWSDYVLCGNGFEVARGSGGLQRLAGRLLGLGLRAPDQLPRPARSTSISPSSGTSRRPSPISRERRASCSSSTSARSSRTAQVA